MAVKTYKKGATTKLSEYFSVYEFDCNGSGCCIETEIDTKLVEYLQKIREHFGKPVTIASGYRCPVHNGKIKNAAKKSKHMQGMAADIKVAGVAPAEVAKYAESIGVLGIGLYDTDKDGHFVHIDTRTTKSFWRGHAQEYCSTFGGSAAAEEPAATGYSLTDFIKDVQKACGAAVDGVAGPETLSKTVTLSAHKNRRHAVVAPVQRRLAALGYTVVGKADGITGPKFEAAVIQLQQDRRCWVDGEITAKNKTWRVLLGME